MKKLKCILLVDDDVVANFLHESLIEQLGITECMDVVTDGLQALQYLQGSKAPNLILLDLNMPVLNGFEFLEFYNSLDIHEKNSIKIIILSSSRRMDDIKRALQLGAADYIVKPVSQEKIKEVIEEHF